MKLRELFERKVYIRLTDDGAGFVSRVRYGIFSFHRKGTTFQIGSHERLPAGSAGSASGPSWEQRRD